MSTCSYVRVVIEISATDAVLAASWMCVLAHGSGFDSREQTRGLAS